MIKYTFKEDFVTIKNASKADPQKIGEALTAITERNDGLLRPDDVVEAARNTRSPLYRHFEWDDSIAATNYRRDQARELIRVIRVVGEDEQPRHAFLSVTTEADGAAYHTLNEVMSSEDLQLRVRRQALRDLEAWQRRYADLQDICELVALASDRLRKKAA